MSGSAALDVVIGLSFVYFVLSLISSGVNESVSGFLAWRAKLLERGIRNLLNDPNRVGLAKDFYNHPLMGGLVRRAGLSKARPGARRPSYVAARTFALVLLDLVSPDAISAEKSALAKVEKSIQGMKDEQLRDTLLLLLREAKGDLEAFRKNVENWFDDSMDRVSGWYRRRVHLFLWVWAIALALALNADTIQITRTLWTDKAVRAAVVAQAQKASAGNGQPQGAAQEVDQVKQLRLPLGWSLKRGDPRAVPSWGGIPSKLLGLLLTAAALTLGAPFWFDLLGKVSRVRNSGPKPSRETPR